MYLIASMDAPHFDDVNYQDNRYVAGKNSFIYTNIVNINTFCDTTGSYSNYLDTKECRGRLGNINFLGIHKASLFFLKLSNRNMSSLIIFQQIEDRIIH
jgi:hypothetical protein